MLPTFYYGKMESERKVSWSKSPQIMSYGIKFLKQVCIIPKVKDFLVLFFWYHPMSLSYLTLSKSLNLPESQFQSIWNEDNHPWIKGSQSIKLDGECKRVGKNDINGTLIIIHIPVAKVSLLQLTSRIFEEHSSTTSVFELSTSKISWLAFPIWAPSFPGISTGWVSFVHSKSCLCRWVMSHIPQQVRWKQHANPSILASLPSSLVAAPQLELNVGYTSDCASFGASPQEGMTIWAPRELFQL